MTTKTETVSAIQTKLFQLQDANSGDSIRVDALKAILNYRKSWLALGKLLHEIAMGGEYHDWGYIDFAQYAKDELCLGKNTARKMLTSYKYIREHEPRLIESLDAGENVDVPGYTTIESLDRLYKANDATDKFRELHRRAFGAEEQESDIRKEVKAELAGPGQDTDIEIRRVALGAVRLLKMAKKCRGIPEKDVEVIESWTQYLCELAGV